MPSIQEVQRALANLAQAGEDAREGAEPSAPPVKTFQESIRELEAHRAEFQQSLAPTIEAMRREVEMSIHLYGPRVALAPELQGLSPLAMSIVLEAQAALSKPQPEAPRLTINMNPSIARPIIYADTVVVHVER